MKHILLLLLIIVFIRCDKQKILVKTKEETYDKLSFIKGAFKKTPTPENLSKMKFTLDSIKTRSYSNFSNTEKSYFHYLYATYYLKARDKRDEDETNLSESFANKSNNNELKEIVFLQKSRILIFKNELTKSYQYALKAKNIEDKLHPGHLGEIYQRFGTLDYEMQNYKKAFFFLKKSIPLFKKEEFDKISYSYYYLGICEMSLNKLRESQKSIKKSLTIAIQGDLPQRVHGCYLVLAATYTKLHIQDSSLYYYRKDGEYMESKGLQTPFEQARMFLNFGAAYNSLNQPNKSLFYLHKCLTMCEKFEKNDLEQYDIYWGCYYVMEDSYKQNKNYEKAYFYSKKLTALESKRQLKEHDVNIKELEGKYNVSKKQAAIKNLQNELSLKDKIVKQQYLIFGGLILLSIIGGLLSYFILKKNKLKKEKEHIELEQRLLLSQMNPHFMFNALTAIQKEIILGNTKTANLYLTKYAELTRLILENSRLQFISIEDELSILENYLLLQKIRYTDKFDYTIDYPLELRDSFFSIPPMLIQPFIENSLEHGFEGIDYKGFLNIKFTHQGAQLVCTIDDNGNGGQTKKNNSKKSHSTTIVGERLKYLSKESGIVSSLSMYRKNSPDIGFYVSLTIPLHDS
jgi:hypothetical protein